MSHYISKQIQIEIEDKNIKKCIISILGITFKEDCPDMRNSKVIDIVNDLKKLSVEIQIADPLVSSKEVVGACGLKLTPLLDLKPCNILLMAVAHNEFKALDTNHINDLIIENGIIYDLKNLYKKGTFNNSSIRHWKL
jgi:UDP-N-acetyl-D-galactosamine dehydrogenase